ncbi:DUF4188 domain-containing protein [Alkalihalobacillus trypoxylicola]|uniref:Transcriptional regulator n=1 Tax=Alkalihalobacillus trypoxylicola TaxID=519424 RepID=A0A161PJP6_9BACI|nr:DUF4188 domain-containing protein [Alkalihalobacillus trypoxylicola]KYG33581.1 transcriptional regulator [Alkalihalobacillus trypoxylicola]
MSKIFDGRFTADHHEKLTVFMIGMRINKWWKIHKWWPVFVAMPPMIRELSVNKQLGCLSMESFFGLRTSFLLQYWRSEEELLAYAKDGTHLKAWKRFNQLVRNNDAVGIYHETYLIDKGQNESLYYNMPAFGLGKASKAIPVTPSLNTARQRLQSR